MYFAVLVVITAFVGVEFVLPRVAFVAEFALVYVSLAVGKDSRLGGLQKKALRASFADSVVACGSAWPCWGDVSTGS